MVILKRPVPKQAQVRAEVIRRCINIYFGRGVTINAYKPLSEYADIHRPNEGGESFPAGSVLPDLPFTRFNPAPSASGSRHLRCTSTLRFRHHGGYSMGDIGSDFRPGRVRFRLSGHLDLRRPFNELLALQTMGDGVNLIPEKKHLKE